MLNQIKALLNDPQLRHKIKEANNLTDAIALLKTFKDKEDHQLSCNSLSQLLHSQLKSIQLDEEELLSIAGGSINRKPTIVSYCGQCTYVCP